MKEFLKPMAGYEGLYEISDKANIRSVARNFISKTGAHITHKSKPMKPYINENGYLVIRLCKNGNSKIKRVHRLLLSTFVGIDSKNPIVNHKDGNKLNLELSNLEWTTSSGNNKHAIDTGLKDLDTIRSEYHVVIDDLDFVAMGAKAAATILQRHGYFTDKSITNLKAAITKSANEHRLYLGKLKAEKTDDPYDAATYHRCGIKGREIAAEFREGYVVHAKGPAKLADRGKELGYWKGYDRNKLIKMISEAALRDGYCYGIKVWYE